MLNADGSTSGIVTEVIHALNEQGQDQVTSYTLQRGGAQRILQAYAVNPNGRRVEAEALREGKVRFRGLVPRATVVMQYRYDASSLPFLRQSLYRIQWFQGYGEAIGIAGWSLWLNAKTALHEKVSGPIHREEATRGNLRRVTWSIRSAPPIIGEPSMPPPREVLNHVAVSTVPDWDTFMRWESALLEGAFRSSPELEATAKTIVEGATDTLEKVTRIHRYLMEEIRYEQDYENSIAGVKPHSATTVLERRYGDCKDKSVLFIALARALDIDVHFAILLTRDRGAIYADVPAQQFNHAIVYVPEQPGMPEGRFYDATADALDVDVLRHDVVGVRALVHDTHNHKSSWRDIPFQSPSFNLQRLRFTLDLAANGNAKGQFLLHARGQIGASIRRFARNRAQFERGMDGMLGRFFPGSNTVDREYLEVADPTQPATVRVGFEAPGVARLDERKLAFKPPPSFLSDLIGKFSLSDRRWDLLMGAPSVFELIFEVRAPDGWRIARAPKKRTIKTDCFTFTRTMKRRRSTVELGYRFVRTCERIPVAQYQEHRRFAKAMEQAYGDAVSFRR
jgi:transglutaminase-like putative cysteine protease